MVVKSCDSLTQVHVPNSSTSVYGSERSGNNTYSFNSHGYRCEEFNPSAKFHIAVIGASNTLGIGLGYTDTFAYKFKVLVSRALDIKEADVCLMNFSIAGASNDYCTRTICRQLSGYRPDVFVYDLAEVPRMEHLTRTSARSLQTHGEDEMSLAFLDLYSQELGAANFLRNILIAQHAFERYRVPYVILNGTAHLSSLERVTACSGLLQAIDTSTIVEHEYTHLMHDQSDCDGHLGKASHNAIAIELLEHYGRNMSRSDAEKSSIRDLASKLKREDTDWKRISNDLISAQTDPARLGGPGRMTRLLLRLVPASCKHALKQWCRRTGSVICTKLAKL